MPCWSSRALQAIQSGQAKFLNERLAIEQQLSLIKTRLRHLVKAIAMGKATEVVFTELQKEEAAKKVFGARLSGLDHLASLSALDVKRFERALVERVADANGVLERHIQQTRQIMRKLIPERIVCTPFDDARAVRVHPRGYGHLCGFIR